MISLLTTLHIIAFATVLGGRIITIPMLQRAMSNGTNERLEELQDTIRLVRYADAALVVAIITGLALFLLMGLPLTATHWSFKLKLVAFGLLFVDIGAYHIAQARVVNHFDSQMLPALKRLNILAVILMCGMVFFATFGN